jgi:hypothetical protein
MRGKGKMRVAVIPERFEVVASLVERKLESPG